MGVKFRLEDLLRLNNLTFCNFLLINFILCRCRWTSLLFSTMKVRGQFSSPKKLINDSNLTQLRFCIGHGGQKIIVAWVGSLCLFMPSFTWTKIQYEDVGQRTRLWNWFISTQILYWINFTIAPSLEEADWGVHRTRKMEAVCLNQHSNCSADDGWGRTASSRIGL